MVTEKEKKQNIEILGRIEEKRVAAGITKTEMYKATGTSSSAFSQWKTGLTKPSQKSISNLAACLHTSASYLLYGIEKTAAQESDGIDQELASILRKLTPEDEIRVMAYIQGLLAARED